MIKLLPTLTFIAAIGAGLVGGVFFAFSNFVMAALARLPVPAGIAAMNSINVTVINPWFMTVFMGTPVICAILAVMAFLKWSEPGSAIILAASLIYIVGSFVVTMVFNVPLNDALAAVTPASGEGGALWTRYLSDWTFWNTVRTVLPLLAMVMFTCGLILRSGA